MQISNLLFNLMSTISSTMGIGDTFEISDDLELDESIEITVPASIVFKTFTPSGDIVQLERMQITATGGVATIVNRGIEQGDTIVTNTDLYKPWNPGAVGYVTVLAYDMLDKEFTTPDRVRIPTVADTTARDALYAGNYAPIGGELVEVTSLSSMQRYNNVTAQWESFDIGTATPLADTGTAGIVEIAEDSEITAGTDTGSTGGFLMATVTQLKKLFGFLTVLSSMAGDDKIGFLDDTDGVMKAITKDNFRETLSATTASKGTVELATDTEAETGTDETRYINSKQAKDNYGSGIYAGNDGIATKSGIDAGTTYTATVTIGRPFNKIRCALLSNVALSGNNFGETIYAIYDVTDTAGLSYSKIAQNDWSNTTAGNISDDMSYSIDSSINTSIIIGDNGGSETMEITGLNYDGNNDLVITYTYTSGQALGSGNIGISNVEVF